MSSAVEEHVIRRISDSPLLADPFPHLYVESVFPEPFYASMRRHWPDSSSLTSLSTTGRVPPGHYPDRFILALRPPEIEKLPPAQGSFWREFQSWFMGGPLLRALMEKFGANIRQRFGDAVGRYDFDIESLIVRDRVNYSLGPHTDAQHKLLSLLFYCPDDDRMKHLGTSIYAPLDPDFRCAGGPHYSADRFRRVKTMEYRANTLFAFFKTDNSFHGVEPITDRVVRDLLLYDVRAHVRADRPAQDRPRIGWRMLKQLFWPKA